MGETGKRIARIKPFGKEKIQKSSFGLYQRNWQNVWESVIVNNLQAPK